MTQAEVRPMKFHGMRHTFATIALAAGANPKAVSEILGHAHVQTTLSLYAQFLPGVHHDTITTAEAMLFSSDSGGGVTNPVITEPDSISDTAPERDETPGTVGFQRVSFVAGAGFEPATFGL